MGGARGGSGYGCARGERAEWDVDDECSDYAAHDDDIAYNAGADFHSSADGSHASTEYYYDSGANASTDCYDDTWCCAP